VALSDGFTLVAGTGNGRAVRCKWMRKPTIGGYARWRWKPTCEDAGGGCEIQISMARGGFNLVGLEFVPAIYFLKKSKLTGTGIVIVRYILPLSPNIF
jgi:hypothetical protein